MCGEGPAHVVVVDYRDSLRVEVRTSRRRASGALQFGDGTAESAPPTARPQRTEEAVCPSCMRPIDVDASRNVHAIMRLGKSQRVG